MMRGNHEPYGGVLRGAGAALVVGARNIWAVGGEEAEVDMVKTYSVKEDECITLS